MLDKLSFALEDHSGLTLGGEAKSGSEGGIEGLLMLPLAPQCHQKLELGLENQHSKLQKTLEELRAYQVGGTVTKLTEHLDRSSMRSGQG